METQTQTTKPSFKDTFSISFSDVEYIASTFEKPWRDRTILERRLTKHGICYALRVSNLWLLYSKIIDWIWENCLKRSPNVGFMWPTRQFKKLFHRRYDLKRAAALRAFLNWAKENYDTEN